MTKLLMPVFYMPPISWFADFLDKDNEISFEQYESFPKQTFRSRAYIYGANGKFSLVIPINHKGNREMKDVEMSFAENWPKLHWKTIKNAYQSSPYFEYYESKLAQIFVYDTKSLLDFNLNALKIIMDILKEEKSYTLTDEYFKSPEALDYRSKYSAKGESTLEMKEYYQTFFDKQGFIKDLSIIDILCNLGPESRSYINNL